MNSPSESSLQAKLSKVESELQALRLEYDDLRRAHERVVHSPGWRILGKVDALLAHVPPAQRFARGVGKRLAQGSFSIGVADRPLGRSGISSALPDQLRVLHASPLFSAEWYRDQNPDVPASFDAAEHYLRYGAREGRSGGPLFNTRTYLANNPDVAAGDLNPLVHFQLTGAREGRMGWTSAEVLGWLAPSIRDPGAALARVWRQPHEPGFLDHDRPVALYVSSLGNFFFKELAALCVLGLREAGYQAEIRNETDASPVPGETALVLAPHEFYFLGRGFDLADDPAFLPSIPIGTEQWQTIWFARALPFMLRADRLLDINLHSADAFVRLGKACRYLALGYSPDAEPYSHITGDIRGKPLLTRKDLDVSALSMHVLPLRDRPLDVLFVGARTPRRSNIFADLAPVLSQHRCFLHLSDVSAPLQTATNVDSELFTLLARNARVVLNVHHSEMPYFEWQRIMIYGAWQQSIVVSERCFEDPFLRNGEHYVGTSTRDLGQAVSNVLAAITRGDPALQQMATAAHETLATHYRLRDCVKRI